MTFQWPWVSRATYDRHTQVLIDAQGAQIVQNEWLRDRYDALLDKYHALKLAGASASESITVPDPITPPDILMRAIRTVSPTQDAAYRMNYQWAMAQQDHWGDEGKMREAAAQILRGSATADTE